MWYGFSIQPNFSKINRFYTYQKKKINLVTKLLLTPLRYSPTPAAVNFFLLFIHNWQFSILRSHLHALFFYSQYYTVIVPLPSRTIFSYNQNTHVIQCRFTFHNNFFFLYWFILKTFFCSFSQIIFCKLTFQGKGYYLYKSIRNTIALRFGYSHRFYLYAYFLSIFFLNKTIILVFGFQKTDLLLFATQLFHAKPINIFTGRGVRFARQIIYKKVGKVSLYR